MKYLAFILTIYVMALSAWPCCGDEAALPSGHEDVCATNSDDHTETDENAHACSPFFHASTYHAFVASPAVTKAPIFDVTEQNGDFPNYAARREIFFPGDIWQPPQLV